MDTASHIPAFPTSRELHHLSYADTQIRRRVSERSNGVEDRGWDEYETRSGPEEMGVGWDPYLDKTLLDGIDY